MHIWCGRRSVPRQRSQHARIKACPEKAEAVMKLQSPQTLKEAQSLNGKLASLNRFLSKSVEKSLPFFKTLKSKRLREIEEEWDAADRASHRPPAQTKELYLSENDHDQGGHCKSKKHRPNYEDDLSQPWLRPKGSPKDLPGNGKNRAVGNAYLISVTIQWYNRPPEALKNPSDPIYNSWDAQIPNGGRNIVNPQNLEVYVDGLVIKSHAEHEILKDIEEIFRNLRKINMKLNHKKCTFGAEEGGFLGHIVSMQGIKACPEKAEAVMKLQSLQTLKEAQNLNGKLASLNRFLSRSSKRNPIDEKGLVGILDLMIQMSNKMK
ncbi:hypothetical protein Tco_0014550 [Tanacetum coccineum]